jgi:ABC-type transport system involved in multi-copper enzyme maturation permease subunit
MIRILAIAKNTFLEAIRDRILYGLVFFALCLILFSLVLGQLSFNEEIRVTIDTGLAGISFFSALISIFLGITLLNKEIEKRTLYTVISRPISRRSYLLGKFLGLLGTLVVLQLTMVLAWIGVLALQGGSPTGGMVMAVVLIFCETMVVIAMALFFTSFSSPFLSGLFCLGLFVAGRNADIIGQLAEHKGMEWMAPALEGVSAVLPSFFLFFPSGKMVAGSFATVHGQFVSSGYLGNAVVYALAYTACFLFVSVLLLNRRDFI